MRIGGGIGEDDDIEVAHERGHRRGVHRTGSIGIGISIGGSIGIGIGAGAGAGAGAGSFRGVVGAGDDDPVDGHIVQTGREIVDTFEDIGTIRAEHQILLVGDEDAHLLVRSVGEALLRGGEDEYTAHGSGASDDVAEGLHGVITGIAGVVGVDEEQGIHTPNRATSG
ncbi:hypothetical protein EB836_14465 [Brevibacterium sp. S111]|nr:hypothetical protein EB836_14465 [Brevibacterium sp. S111]